MTDWYSTLTGITSLSSLQINSFNDLIQDIEPDSLLRVIILKNNIEYFKELLQIISNERIKNEIKEEDQSKEEVNEEKENENLIELNHKLKILYDILSLKTIKNNNNILHICIQESSYHFINYFGKLFQIIYFKQYQNNIEDKKEEEEDEERIEEYQKIIDKLNLFFNSSSTTTPSTTTPSTTTPSTTIPSTTTPSITTPSTTTPSITTPSLFSSLINSIKLLHNLNWWKLTNYYQETPLHLIAASGNKKLLECFLLYFSIDSSINIIEDKWNRRPVEVAYQNGYKLLLQSSNITLSSSPSSSSSSSSFYLFDSNYIREDIIKEENDKIKPKIIPFQKDFMNLLKNKKDNSNHFLDSLKQIKEKGIFKKQDEDSSTTSSTITSSSSSSSSSSVLSVPPVPSLSSSLAAAAAKAAKAAAKSNDTSTSPSSTNTSTTTTTTTTTTTPTTTTFPSIIINLPFKTIPFSKIIEYPYNIEDINQKLNNNYDIISQLIQNYKESLSLSSSSSIFSSSCLYYDPNGKDFYGYSIIHKASLWNSIDLLQIFIEYNQKLLKLFNKELNNLLNNNEYELILINYLLNSSSSSSSTSSSTSSIVVKNFSIFFDFNLISSDKKTPLTLAKEENCYNVINFLEKL